MKYEQQMEELANEPAPGEWALNAGEEAMGFVLTLHNMFKENGYDLPAEPDVELLANLIDAVHAELAAACLFLSSDSFSGAPTLLRGIAKSIETADLDFTSPDGETGKSVPVVVRKGFERLAKRIEATKVQKTQMQGLLEQTLEGE